MELIGAAMASQHIIAAAKAKAVGAVLFWSLVALLPGVGVLVLLWLVVSEFRAVRREREHATPLVSKRARAGDNAMPLGLART